MAWYNNLGDLGGDLKAIASGHNPSNTSAPRQVPINGPTPGAPGGLPQPYTSGNSLVDTNVSPPNDPNSDSGGNSDPAWWQSLLADAGKYGGAVLSFLNANKGTLLQGAGIADAAYRETQANKFANQALSTSQDAYNAKAPLRALGIAGLTNAGQGNPFATRSGGALPIAGQGGLGANLPPGSPTSVLNQQGANVTSGGPQQPRNPNIPLAPTPPNLNPSAPMRIAGL